MTVGNRTAVTLLLISSTLAPSCAHKETPAARSTPAPASSPKTASTTKTEVYYGKGTITKTNPDLPSLEMDHEEIVDLMPAMRMEFYVKDVSMLKGLKPGDRIEFKIENGVGGLQITEITKL